METIQEAKAKLETEGLVVSYASGDGLWVAGSVSHAGEGINLSHDACALRQNGSEWVAVFPAGGLLTYEVPGSLPELVSLILNVYKQHRQTGGPFSDAFKTAVSNPEQFRVGRPLTRV